MAVPDELQCNFIRGPDELMVKKILELESLFPVKIQHSKEKLTLLFENPANMHVILKKGEVAIGYLLATPHNDAVEELKGDDAEIDLDDCCYYLDQIAVIPEEREGLKFLLLVDALIEKLQQQGIRRISSHILATEKLHILIARKFRRRLILRRKVCLAMHGYAPFEYMKAWCEKE